MSFLQVSEEPLASCNLERVWVPKEPPPPLTQRLFYKFHCTISPGRSSGKTAGAWHNTSLPALLETAGVNGPRVD
jgi:hypothetical protein